VAASDVHTSGSTLPYMPIEFGMNAGPAMMICANWTYHRAFVTSAFSCAVALVIHQCGRFERQ
jgi:hypothetical protein